MSVIVVATLRPLDQHRHEVLAAFEDVIAAVHADDAGCELYALHEGDDRVVMIEKWSNPEALEAHSAGAHLAELGRRLDGTLAGPMDVQVLRPHPAGTPQQGTI